MGKNVDMTTRSRRRELEAARDDIRPGDRSTAGERARDGLNADAPDTQVILGRCEVISEGVAIEGIPVEIIDDMGTAGIGAFLGSSRTYMDCIYIEGALHLRIKQGRMFLSLEEDEYEALTEDQQPVTVHTITGRRMMLRPLAVPPSLRSIFG